MEKEAVRRSIPSRRCSRCGNWRTADGPMRCAMCGATESETAQLPSRGIVVSATTVFSRSRQPRTVVLVHLDEGIQVVGLLDHDGAIEADSIIDRHVEFVADDDLPLRYRLTDAERDDTHRT